jgi:hypothetical protein
MQKGVEVTFFVEYLVTRQKKPLRHKAQGVFHKALAVTYFRMGRPHTIIGETPFHF